MKCSTYSLSLALALFCTPTAWTVELDFDLTSGTLVSNPPPESSPPDMYHSGTIALPQPLLIEPGQADGIWVKFRDLLHLEVIDEPSNRDGVERLRTHVQGRVIPDAAGNDFTDLWVDVTLTGVSGHIRESFEDPNSTHPTRLLLGTSDGGPPVFRDDNTRNDDPTGDWDGADDNSGTDLWFLSHEDVVVDKESHAVANGFVLGTWADDLTDDSYFFHDIHWEITNHGPNSVEIINVQFWQDGNILRIGEWVPEPSTLALFTLVAAGLGMCRVRRM